HTQPEATMSQLNASQVFILKAISGFSGTMTREQLLRYAEERGIAINAGTLGPVSEGAWDNHPESLTVGGYIRPCRDEAGNKWFELTAKGEKAADLWRTRERA